MKGIGNAIEITNAIRVTAGNEIFVASQPTWRPVNINIHWLLCNSANLERSSILAMSSGLIRACISNAIQQAPSGFERSAKVQQVGESILARSVEKCEVFHEFCLKLIEFMRQEIANACKRLKCTSSKRSRLWCNFHKHRTDPKGCLILLWKEMIEDLEVDSSESSSGAEEDPLLMQAVLRLLFEDCMTEYFVKEKEGASARSTVRDKAAELTSDEMNTLRYACGYVAHSLLKKFEKRKGGNTQNLFVALERCQLLVKEVMY